MSQKTHPIGFRIGVSRAKPVMPRQGTAPMGYNLWGDLHGQTSRWNVLGGHAQYGEMTQRDRVLKQTLEQLLEEDGYLVNKTIIVRTVSYVGVYVDVWRLIDPLLVPVNDTPSTGPITSRDHASNQNSGLADKLSIVEYGLPVRLQIVELNQLVQDGSEVGTDEGKGVTAIDLRKALTLPVPCCNLLAKIIGYRLSGDRRHREQLRVIMKEILRSRGNRDGVMTGFQMILKGRVGGSERSRILRYRSGPRPRHTVSAALDHGFFEVAAPSGKRSVTIQGYLG